jgi:putative restriction endonuclease
MAVDQLARARLIWNVLIEVAASDVRTITYGALAKRIGIYHRPLRYALDPIQQYCLSNRLPPLTSLVVIAGTEFQGTGFVSIKGSAADINDTHSFDWSTVENPFLDEQHAEQVAQILSDPRTASDLYARVKIRGQVQRVFRDVVFAAYEGRCAICQCDYRPLLEAAHIARWSTAPHLRLDPRNGLLLCRNHHALFDANWLVISDDYVVHSRLPKKLVAKRPDNDPLFSVLGRRLHLPKSAGLRPNRDLIRIRMA